MYVVREKVRLKGCFSEEMKKGPPYSPAVSLARKVSAPKRTASESRSR